MTNMFRRDMESSPPPQSAFSSGLMGGLGNALGGFLPQQQAQQQAQQPFPGLTREDAERMNNFTKIVKSTLPNPRFIDELRAEIDDWIKLN